MCGIVAAVAKNSCVVPFLVQGLEALEYRGYDSVGVALLTGDSLTRVRSISRVKDLERRLAQAKLTSTQGIGHTRWATHGAPSERNAHPHTSACEEHHVAVVHNGIIENHEELRQKLQAKGYCFGSDTDTEVIVHLLHEQMKTGASLKDAVRFVRGSLKGQFAFVAMADSQPGVLVATRHEAPLLLGIGEDGNYLASDVSALLAKTRRVVYLEEDDVAVVMADSWEVVDLDGEVQPRKEVLSELSSQDVTKGDFRHHMLKEIYEQPQAILKTLQKAPGIEALDGRLFGFGAGAAFKHVRSVTVLACGTSYHAGLILRDWIERFAGLACHVEIASEFRYRNPVVANDSLVVAISQSGETADTKAALKFAMGRSAVHALSICNVAGSALTRMSDFQFLTEAGPEQGVASTKAFTTQLVAAYLLALSLARAKGTMTDAQLSLHMASLHEVPALVSQVLHLTASLQAWAHQLSNARSAIYLGRGSMHAIAAEAALKLKEITYIHAEAYAAGELKHGPLALIDEHMPVIVSVVNNDLVDKVHSNVEEVLARKGCTFVLQDGDVVELAAKENRELHTLRLPSIVNKELGVFTHVVAHQLLAYYVALEKGTDIDKPRNLAKSVTVE